MVQTVIITALASAFLIVVLLAAVFQFAFLLDVTFGGHDFTTTRAARIKVAGILRQFNKDKSVLYDLGSCRGDFLFGVMRHSPNLRAFGVDNSRFRNRLCRIKAFLLRRPAVFLRGDLFDADVSKADAAYLYLDQSLMEPLEKKLRNELKPGSIVITNTQHLPTWPVSQTVIVHPKKPEFEKLFVYVK